MRSSDWSSDVCSSDLQQVALNALARDVGAAALGARGDLVDLVQEDDAVLLDSGDRGADYRLLVEQLVALLGDQHLIGLRDGHAALLDASTHRLAEDVAEIEHAHGGAGHAGNLHGRSEEHTSELQSLMRISYAVFCLKKKKINNRN